MGKYWAIPAAGLLAVFAAGPSFAADPVIETPVASTYNWTGFYLGVSGGYLDPNLGIGFGATNFEFGDSSYLIGGTVGFNYQVGNFVLGVEGDYSYAEIDGTTGDIYGFFAGDDVTSAEGDYFATIRGRLGYAFDRVLVYGTGGAAFTDIDYTTAAGSFSEDLSGYTVGGGVEYAFTDHFTAKAEYLYADFGDNTTAQFPGDVNTDVDMNVFRVGLNYKF